MKTEKGRLEEYAIKYFIAAYPGNLSILNHSDKPDFTLLDNDNQSKIGVEVAHLWHDNNEVKMLLGRSEQKFHGVICAIDLINALNRLLAQKANKIINYKKHDKFYLVIRIASPIFDLSTFNMYENSIICPINDYDKIWLVLDDNNKKTRWTELKEIKLDNFTQQGLAGSFAK